MNFNENEFFQIGVSFKPFECIFSNGDSYLFVVWYLNENQRFNFMYPSFSRGASAGFIYFNPLEQIDLVFKKLNKWIEIYRNNLGNIPIILIGTQRDQYFEENYSLRLDEFIEENKIDGLYYASKNPEMNKLIKEELFRFLITTINKSPKNLHKLSMIFPLEEDEFKEFSQYFSKCPICKQDNHLSNLKNFYFNNETESLIMKAQLMELMEKSFFLENKYDNKISIGIPCCKCYQEIFKQKSRSDI
jgi:GTPase SAR1 family protein